MARITESLTCEVPDVFLDYCRGFFTLLHRVLVLLPWLLHTASSSSRAPRSVVEVVRFSPVRPLTLVRRDYENAGIGDVLYVLHQHQDLCLAVFRYVKAQNLGGVHVVRGRRSQGRQKGVKRCSEAHHRGVDRYAVNGLSAWTKRRNRQSRNITCTGSCHGGECIVLDSVEFVTSISGNFTEIVLKEQTSFVVESLVKAVH